MLASLCKDATVEKEKVEEMLLSISNDENNPFGAIDDTDEHGETAVRWASTNGRDDILSLLLEYNADVNTLNDLQQTSLHAACWNSQLNCCKLLLDANASVESKDKDGCTSLHKVIHLFFLIFLSSNFHSSYRLLIKAIKIL